MKFRLLLALMVSLPCATPASAQWFTYDSGVPLPTVYSREFGTTPLISNPSVELDLDGNEGTIEFFAGGAWFEGEGTTDQAHNLKVHCVLSNGRRTDRRVSPFWTKSVSNPEPTTEITTFWEARYAIYLDNTNLYFQSGITMHRVGLPDDIEPAKRPVHFSIATSRDGDSFSTRVIFDGRQSLVIAGVGYGEGADGTLTVGGLPPNARGAVRLVDQRSGNNRPPFLVQNNVQVLQGSVGGLRIWSKPYGAEVFSAVAGAPRMRRYGQFDIERSLAFPRDGDFTGSTVPQFRHLVAYSDFRGDADRHRIKLPSPIDGNWLNDLQATPSIVPSGHASGLAPPRITEAPVFTIVSGRRRPDIAVASPSIGASLLYRDGVLVGNIERRPGGGFTLHAGSVSASMEFRGDRDELVVRFTGGDSSQREAVLGMAFDGEVVLVRPSMRSRTDVVNGADPFFISHRVQNTNVAARGYHLGRMDLFNFDLSSGTNKFVVGEPGGRGWVLTNGAKVAPIWCHEVQLQRSSAGIQVDVATNETTVAEQITTRMGLKQTWPSGSLSANASYQKGTRSTNFRSQVRATLSSWKHDLALVVDPVTLILSPGFADAVLDLRDGRVSAEQFVDTWGTHYVRTMTYGALAVAEKSVDRSVIARERSQDVNIDASLQAGISRDPATGTELSGTTVSGGAGRSTKLSTSKSLSTTAEEFRTIGATMTAGTDGASATLDGSFPIQPELRPIYELLTPALFEDPEIYHGVRQRLQRTLNGLAKRLASGASPSDGTPPDSAVSDVIPASEKTYYIQLDSAASSDDTWLYGSVFVKPYVRSDSTVRSGSTGLRKGTVFDRLSKAVGSDMPSDYVFYEAPYLDETSGAVSILQERGGTWLFKNTEADGDFDGDYTVQIEEWDGPGAWRKFLGSTSEYGMTRWGRDSNESYAAAHPDLVDGEVGRVHYVIHSTHDIGQDSNGEPLHVAPVAGVDDPKPKFLLGIRLDDWREWPVEDQPMLRGAFVLDADRFQSKKQYLELASGSPAGLSLDAFRDQSSLSEAAEKFGYKPQITNSRIVENKPLQRLPGWFNLILQFWVEEPEAWRTDLAERLMAETGRPPLLVRQSHQRDDDARLVRFFPFMEDERARAVNKFLGETGVSPDSVLGGALVVPEAGQLLPVDGLTPYGMAVRLDVSLGAEAEGVELRNESGSVVLEVKSDGAWLRLASSEGAADQRVCLHEGRIYPGEWHEIAFSVGLRQVAWAFDGRTDHRSARELYGAANVSLFGVSGSAADGSPLTEEAYRERQRLIEEGGAELIPWSHNWTCRLLKPKGTELGDGVARTRMDEVIFASTKGLPTRELQRLLGRPRVLPAAGAPTCVARVSFDQMARGSEPGLPELKSSSTPQPKGTVDDEALVVDEPHFLPEVRVRGSHVLHLDLWPGERSTEVTLGGLRMLVEGEASSGARMALEIIDGEGVLRRLQASPRDLIERAAWHKVLLEVNLEAGELSLTVDGDPLISVELTMAECDALRTNASAAAVNAMGDDPDGVDVQAARIDEVILFSGELSEDEIQNLLERPRKAEGEAPPTSLIRPEVVDEGPDDAISALRPEDAALGNRVAAYYPLDDDLLEKSGWGESALEANSAGAGPADLDGHLAAGAGAFGATLGARLEPGAFTFALDFEIVSAPGPIVSLGAVSLATEPVRFKLPNGKEKVLPIGSALVVRLRSASGAEMEFPLRWASGKQILIPARSGARVPGLYEALAEGWQHLVVSFDVKQRRVSLDLAGRPLAPLEFPSGFQPVGASGVEIRAGAPGVPMSAHLDELLVLRGSIDPKGPIWAALKNRAR